MTKKLIPTEGCDDCEFWRIETDGEITVCDECAFEQTGETVIDEDDGQPSWEQEWQDFGECYSDEYGGF